jgi:hypothetical protein
VSKSVKTDFEPLKKSINAKIDSLKTIHVKAKDPTEVQQAIDALNSALTAVRGACPSMQRMFEMLSGAELGARSAMKGPTSRSVKRAVKKKASRKK